MSDFLLDVIHLIKKKTLKLMKSLTKLIIVFTLLFLVSCEYGTRIKVSNKSGESINEILIKTNFDSLIVNDLDSDNSSLLFLDFKKSKAVDGIIKLTIKKSQVERNYNFGYFSNGIPPRDIDITIEKDTVLFKDLE